MRILGPRERPSRDPDRRFREDERGIRQPDRSQRQVRLTFRVNPTTQAMIDGSAGAAIPTLRMNTRTIKNVSRLEVGDRFSDVRVAALFGIYKRVVTKCVGRTKATEFYWVSACDMDEGELERYLLGKPTSAVACTQPDYGRITGSCAARA